MLPAAKDPHSQIPTSKSPFAAANDSNLDFLDLTDIDMLEPYLDYTDVFDTNLTELLEADLTTGLISSGTGSESVQDENYTFTSPLPWVADWSVETLRDDTNYSAIVEQRVFNLPRIPEINTLLRLYFMHAHHRLPVLDQRYFYELMGQSRSSQNAGYPLSSISLALLYAIMFSACAFLRTDSTEASYVKAIRSMRCEYYSRAATLFKLGCEQDPMRQVQICLLLSTYRNYPGQFYDNERWIIKAYRIMQNAGQMPTVDEERALEVRPEWKRLCACWFHRFTNAQLGLKWTNSPDLFECTRYPWHEITMNDFKDDFEFSWHSSADLKLLLTQLFVQQLKLDIHICQLDKILWKRTVCEMLATREIVSRPPGEPLECLFIENVEASLQNWWRNHASLLTIEAPATMTAFEKRQLHVEQLVAKLTYE
jgi:hypothetical protein